MKKILFVCLGNICRSSSAEGVMKHLVEEAGRADEFLIDSAGILSYHQGELPDSRMRAHAARRGYKQTLITSNDFPSYNLHGRRTKPNYLEKPNHPSCFG